MVRPSTAAPLTISPSALAAALGAERGAFYRARTRGDIPQPDRPTLGGYARWSVALARRIVRKAGRTVPRAWLEAGAK